MIQPNIGRAKHRKSKTSEEQNIGRAKHRKSKTSEEQNIGRATVVLLNLHRLTITKRTENLNNFLLYYIYTTSCANVYSAMSDKHALSKIEPRFSMKSSSKTAKRICFHDMSCSFFKILFDQNVNCDMTPFCVHARHMIVVQRLTGAPHSVTRPLGAGRDTTLSDSAAGRGT